MYFTLSLFGDQLTFDNFIVLLLGFELHAKLWTSPVSCSTCVSTCRIMQIYSRQWQYFTLRTTKGKIGKHFVLIYFSKSAEYFEHSLRVICALRMSDLLTLSWCVPSDPERTIGVLSGSFRLN